MSHRNQLLAGRPALRRSLLVASTVALCLFTAPTRLEAQEETAPFPVPVVLFQELTFGMVGMAPTQTARLNVVNLAPYFPCRVGLIFLDAAGKTVKEAVVERLEPGKAAWLDVARAEIANPPSPARAQVRGVVRSIRAVPILGAPQLFPRPLLCTVLPTLEVFDNVTGATVVILSEARSTPGRPVPLPLTPNAEAP